MLTGAQAPTSGAALVDGHVVTRSHRAGGSTSAGAQHGQGSRLGYCPQFDPLLDLLTAREQLALYARLKVDSPHVCLQSLPSQCGQP